MSARRTILAGLLGWLLLAAASAAWAGPIGDHGPVAEVKALYDKFEGGNSPAETDLELLRRLATPGLRALLDREAACQQDGKGPCRYDFSVIVDGQDSKVSHVEVALAKGTPARAVVEASFLNFGKPHKVVYLFTWDGGRWRLTDVRSGVQPGWSLVELLK